MNWIALEVLKLTCFKLAKAVATGDFGHDDVVLNWNQYFTDLDLLKERR